MEGGRFTNPDSDDNLREMTELKRLAKRKAVTVSGALKQAIEDSEALQRVIGDGQDPDFPLPDHEPLNTGPRVGSGGAELPLPE